LENLPYKNIVYYGGFFDRVCVHTDLQQFFGTCRFCRAQRAGERAIFFSIPLHKILTHLFSAIVDIFFISNMMLGPFESFCFFNHTLIKNKIKFSSVKRKFRWERMQSHLWERVS